MYHRVADVEHDPWDLCVSPEHFKAHMAELAELGTCVTVGELLPAIHNGDGSPVFAVSFDDGYADNYTAGLPTMEKFGIPGTFFVVSDAIGAEGEFWWDALARVAFRAAPLPARLELIVRGSPWAWDLGPAIDYPDPERMADIRWRADEAPPPGPRSKFYLMLWELLFEQEPKVRDRLASEILAWAGTEARARPDQASLDVELFAALAAGPRIEIGAHTRNHPALTALPEDQRRDEMAGGRDRLESRLGRRVKTFSYPYGRKSAETRALAAETGFTAVCTSRSGAITPETDPLDMPRLQVKNWDSAQFRRKVESYF